MEKTRVGFCIDCGSTMVVNGRNLPMVVHPSTGNLVPAGHCGCRQDDFSNMAKTAVLSEILNGILNGKGGK